MAEGKVLVIGGCGFVGSHVVSALLEETTTWSSVHVMSRNPDQNKIAGAIYHAGDINSKEQIHTLLADISPSTIIHAASPRPARGDQQARFFLRTNVLGTQNLLDCIASNKNTKALVYTSSVSVMSNHLSFKLLEESAPTVLNAPRADFYPKSKALAENLVLEANGKGGLRTCSLRIASVYGERDNQLTPGVIEALRAGHQRNRIGSGTTLFDLVSAGNVASAHVLAAKALLQLRDESLPKVEGEAFFITDGDPVPFWSLSRKIWALAGDRTPLEEVRVIPAWFLLTLASVLEWLYWIFTLGRRSPSLSRHSMEFTCMTRTYSIEKAKRVLGYSPVANREEHLEKGVAWALRVEAEAAQKKI